MTKPTVLALDPGSKNTGYAYRGSSTLIEETGTLPYKEEKLINHLKALINRLNPDTIVIGQPERGYVVDLSENLKNRLESLFPIPVVTVEETNSSKLALRSLIAANQSKSARTKKIHSSSAAVILQEYENLYED